MKILRRLFPSACLAFILGAGVLAYPRLKAKWAFDRIPKQATIGVDWDDIAAFSKGQSVASVLSDFRIGPRGAMMMALDVSRDDEAIARANNFSIFWKLEPGKNPRPLFERFMSGDGVVIFGEHTSENPYIAAGLRDLLINKNGYLPLVEFQPAKERPWIAPDLKARVLKTHILPSREVMAPATEMWKIRLVRAVRERAVQLLLVRLSPQMTLEEQSRFLKLVGDSLQNEGIELSGPRSLWEDPKKAEELKKIPALGKTSHLICLFLGITLPLIGLFWLMRRPHHSPILSFFLLSVFSVTGAAMIHGLGANYESILGFSSLRGVKLQLIGPLLIFLLLFLSVNDFKKWGDTPLKWKHVVLAGLALAVAGGLYLSRSGNHPLLPVTQFERHVRDAIETWLGVRPRTKEFLFGHPLMILGFFLRQKWGGKGGFIQGGGLFMMLGLIGQISILNTAMHFYTPFSMSLMRICHGIWMGTILAVPLCYVASLYGRGREPLK